MLRLALDTSTRLGSVALEEEGSLLGEALLPVRATHSETVLPEVGRLLALCGREREELRGVAVGSGPGSFTGVRIAASVAKGLCFRRGVSLHAYSSLLAVAAGTGLEGGVCALFDARRGEVYGAAYRRVAPPEAALEPCVLPLERLLERLDPGEWAFAGEGALLHSERIVGRGGRLLPAHLAHPRASALLWLAREWPEGGRVEDPAAWEPHYVRRSGARRAPAGAGAGDGTDGGAR